MKTSTTMTSMLDRTLRFCSLNDSVEDGSAHLFAGAGMIATDYDGADIIVFNGGRDIGTAIYNETPISNRIPLKPSMRDQMECDIFDDFVGKDKLFVGICRGAQLLNCLNGGTLWQDVNNHNRDHKITDLITGRSYVATSTHHQMMRPNYKTGKVLAIAHESTSKYADNYKWLKGMDHGQIPYDCEHDIEIVWYPETGSLCIQGHPEYIPNSHFTNYCLDLIRHYREEVRNVM